MEESIAAPAETAGKSHKKFLIILTIVTTIISWAVGFLFVGDSMFGFMRPFQNFIEGLGSWSWIVFSILFVAVISLFFFLSGIGTAFIQLSVIMFTAEGALPWKAFILSTVCIFLGSIIQYWIGRRIGVKPFKWAIGEKDYAKAVKVAGSPTIIGLALLLPYFPDSLVCFLAGASKNKFAAFWPVALIMRTVGVAGLCFVSTSLLNLKTWTDLAGVIGVMPTLLIIFSAIVSFLLVIVSLFVGGRWLEKKLAQRHQKSENLEQ